MIQTNKNNHKYSSEQQRNSSFEQLQTKYIRLLAEFNSFKESAIGDHEKLIQQQNKINSQNQKFVKKLQKKYESLLHEERLKSAKIKDKLQAQIQTQKQTYQEIIENKNRSIEKLTQMIQDSQKQKTQIVEQNTQNLINIVRSQQTILQTKKYSHTELMKMYKYLLEQNNCLKKQLMKVQNINEKTKRNKKGSPILYTDLSEIGQSKYVTTSNYVNASMIKREKTLSNDDKKSLLQMKASGLSHSQIQPKPSSIVYKQKANPTQKSKLNSTSAYVSNDQSSLIIEQKPPKKKQAKKQQIPLVKKPK